VKAAWFEYETIKPVAIPASFKPGSGK